MSGIDIGILVKAYPLSTEQIELLEKQTLEEQKAFAYLDDEGELCFALPAGVEIIKDLAWHKTYELIKDGEILLKKLYKKDSLETYYLVNTWQKSSIEDTWNLVYSSVGLLDESLLDEFILE